MKKVEIYSDWWARPNPWAGGYGTIIRFWKKEKELSWFEEHSTNNRMELTWAIKWLEALKEPCEVELFTDSSYVVNWIEKGWAKKWKENNWMRTKSQKATNYDLWEELLNLTEKHKVHFNWVKWHIWHIENGRCDTLATNEILAKYPEKASSLDNKNKTTKQDLIKKVLNTGLDSSKNNIKITSENQPCKKCWTPVVKAIPKKKNTKNKSFYYKFYLHCPNCKTNYFVDEGKVML